jgi:hypothetical protein
MDYEIIGGTHDLLINQTLGEAMQVKILKKWAVFLTQQIKLLSEKNCNPVLLLKHLL